MLSLRIRVRVAPRWRLPLAVGVVLLARLPFASNSWPLGIARAADKIEAAAAPANATPKVPAPTPEEAAENATAEKRLGEATRFLASRELEGRGLGSHGLDLAADYLAGQFRQIGLKTDLYNGQPFQRFTLPIGTKIGPAERNTLELVGPPAAGENRPTKIRFKLGVDFNPMALGGSARFDLPLVFVGYGITAKGLGYDDYKGIDAKNKAVIVLRHQPQRSNPHGLFGDRDSEYAAFRRKVSNAYEHGAAAIIFTTDEDEIRRSVTSQRASLQAAIDELRKTDEAFRKIEHPTLEQSSQHVHKVDELAEQVKAEGRKLSEQFDPLGGVDRGGEGGEERSTPVMYATREAVARMLKAFGAADLSAIEHEIDADAKPASRELAGWRIVGETNLARERTPSRNVLGELEGVGPHADETIIIGAHYDHLGYGEFGSLDPAAGHVIRPGADDNGSGTAALLEVARRLAARKDKLPRRILFISFTGEERGLLGSAHYVRDPLIPLDKTIVMLNMDMVGRMKDNKLTVSAIDTAPEFEPLVRRLNERYGFKIIREMGGYGPSDQASFYAKHVPVLFFFTGLHADYHRSTDTADKLDLPDMRRVADLTADVAVALAEAEGRPHYSESTASNSHPSDQRGDRPYFGSVPDFGRDNPGGYAISGVTKGSPAELGGLKGGDVVIRLGDSRIGGLEDFDSALRKHRAADKVPVWVRRDGKELHLEVTLGPPR